MLGPGSASGRGCSCSSLFDPASFSATDDEDEDEGEEDDMLVPMQRLSSLFLLSLSLLLRVGLECSENCSVFHEKRPQKGAALLFASASALIHSHITNIYYI